MHDAVHRSGINWSKISCVHSHIFTKTNKSWQSFRVTKYTHPKHLSLFLGTKFQKEIWNVLWQTFGYFSATFLLHMTAFFAAFRLLLQFLITFWTLYNLHFYKQWTKVDRVSEWRNVCVENISPLFLREKRIFVVFILEQKSQSEMFEYLQSEGQILL